MPNIASSSQKAYRPLQNVTVPCVTGLPPPTTAAVNVTMLPLVTELEDTLSVVALATGTTAVNWADPELLPTKLPFPPYLADMVSLAGELNVRLNEATPFWIGTELSIVAPL